MYVQLRFGYFFFFFYRNFFKKINLFIYGRVGSSLLRTGFPQLRRERAILRCGAQASHHSGFSCCGARALCARASVVVACRLSTCGSWALERRLRCCGAQTQLLRGMRDLPRSGLKPIPCTGRQILNHCTTREVPGLVIF